MKILIINGPNLNLVGKREPGIYGATDIETYLKSLRKAYPGVVIDHVQTNIEGEIVDAIQRADARAGARKRAYDGVLLNAGGYTHTSVAIRDAIAAVGVSVVEVHISNIFAREEFRHASLLAPVCRGSIVGFGLDSYNLGVQALTGMVPAGDTSDGRGPTPSVPGWSPSSF